MTCFGDPDDDKACDCTSHGGDEEELTNWLGLSPPVEESSII